MKHAVKLTLAWLIATATHSVWSPAQTSADWYMNGANPLRTSAVSEEALVNLGPIWHRPIGAYIPPYVQIIAVDNVAYLSTSAGLLAFNAEDGTLLWRFDTQMPLGNSPTVFKGFVYVAGYDRKVYVLSTTSQNSNNEPVYTYDLASYGYDTNPLVVSRENETWVYLGDRGGTMHAFTFSEETQTGQARWTFQAGGGIHFSASYFNDAIYFAAGDNYAYALRAATGSQVWRSGPLMGEGFYSFWPVIHQPSNSLILARGSMYRYATAGTPDVEDLGAVTQGTDLGVDYNDIWGSTSGPTVGPITGTDNGKPLLDVTSIRTYHIQKPWRRAFVFLNLDSGVEMSFEGGYAPFTFTQTKNGNIYPPVVGPDGLVYSNSMYDNNPDSKGRVMGWDHTKPNQVRLLGMQAANTEPIALSVSGNKVLRNHANDRIGSAEGFFEGVEAYYWSYDLETQLGAGYDPAWFITPGAISRHQGWFQGVTDFRPEPLEVSVRVGPGEFEIQQFDVNTVNAAYHHTGIQNPLVYHKGKILVHRSNTLIAYGQGSNRGRLSVVTVSPEPQTEAKPLSVNHLRSVLSTEVQKIVSAGSFLRPGYTTTQLGNYGALNNYFSNPGDTLVTLSNAYPHLSASLQTIVRTYLADLYARYFEPSLIVTDSGWAGLAPREAMPMPQDLAPFAETVGSSVGGSFPENAYALYLYAKNVPNTNNMALYQKAKSILPAAAPTQLFSDYPYEHNRWLTGYLGFLALQRLAFSLEPSSPCSALPSAERASCTSAQTELANLKVLRVELFDKDSPFISATRDVYYRKQLDIARNFMYLCPELGDWYGTNLLQETTEGLREYTSVAPYWLAHHFTAYPGEATFQPLYSSPALFQAKAWIEKPTRQELTKFLDAPAFARGDLFFIQNLIAALMAPDQDSGVLPPRNLRIVGN